MAFKRHSPVLALALLFALAGAPRSAAGVSDLSHVPLNLPLNLSVERSPVLSPAIEWPTLTPATLTAGGTTGQQPDPAVPPPVLGSPLNVLPLIGGLIVFLWLVTTLLARRRRSEPSTTLENQTPPTLPPTQAQPISAPDADGNVGLAARTGSVIAADRESIAERTQAVSEAANNRTNAIESPSVPASESNLPGIESAGLEVQARTDLNANTSQPGIQSGTRSVEPPRSTQPINPVAENASVNPVNPPASPLDDWANADWESSTSASSTAQPATPAPEVTPTAPVTPTTPAGTAPASSTNATPIPPTPVESPSANAAIADLPTIPTAIPPAAPSPTAAETESSSVESGTAPGTASESPAIANLGTAGLAMGGAIAASVPPSIPPDQSTPVSDAEGIAQSTVEAAKFDVGQTEDGLGDGEVSSAPVAVPAPVAAPSTPASSIPLSREELATVDATLAELPDGYDESRISLLPRDPYWAYTYWDVPNSHKEALRQQGGTRLALRLYDVTDINVEVQNPHSLQQFECEEMARDWYVPVPVSDRDYFIEIGYLTESGGWLLLARSLPVRVPPIYPSDWEDDQFVTVDWDTPLEGQSLLELSPPGNRAKVSFNRLFDRDQSLEIQQVAGSLFGSMQQVPAETLSSFAFASGVPGVTTSGIGMSGVGMAAGIGMSGVGMSGVGMSGIGMSGVGMSGIGLLGFGLSEMNMSGVGMSGAGLLGIPGWSLSGVGMMSGIGMAGLSMSGGGMMSGIGMSGLTMSGIGMSGAGMLTMSGAGFASMPPVRPRQFWLVADAELIIYGATEPDATVTIAGQPIPLNPDGTFRIQISFQDGQIDFPIMAVAADGEQNRSIHMTFNRDTLSRNTNTRDEAQEEWPGS